MFTGIIIGKATVVQIEKKNNFQTHAIMMPKEWIEKIKIGDSVSQNGCCLTVTKITENIVSFDLIDETLAKTNLGSLQKNDQINIELAANIGDPIGGHLMSGHIMDTGKIIAINKTTNNHQVTIQCKPDMEKYIFEKGYIGVDGISLTINNSSNSSFSVNLIPETLSRTTIGAKKVGDLVNLEIDNQTQITVDTINKVLQNMQLGSNKN